MPKKVTTSVAGHELATGEWLDLHFAASRPQYEQIIRAVGILPGWSVLDAGCGSGSFLPLINELVGEAGKITALDLAPENIAIVQEQIDDGEFSCPVEARQGTLLALPYADNTFDLAWSANVSQYLTDDEFVTMLHELCRVTRPGGLVAIKEYDNSGTFWGPMDPFLWMHFWEKGARMLDRPELRQIWGCTRTLNLPTWLRQSGFTDIHFETVAGNWRHPLRPEENEFLHQLSEYWARRVEQCELPEAELREWRRLVRDIDGPDHLLKHPDFFARESHGLVIGVVPMYTSGCN